jgi:hypothetical protein
MQTRVPARARKDRLTGSYQLRAFAESSGGGAGRTRSAAFTSATVFAVELEQLLAPLQLELHVVPEGV